MKQTDISDNNEPREQGENKKHSIFSTRSILVLYDIIVCIAVDALILGVYRGAESIKYKDILIHSVISMAAIFIMRLVWSVYKQIWRYGGIQSYIRLLAADACAFIIYAVLERFLPITHISFVRVLSISSMCLLTSLAMRMTYHYAYKCCMTDTRKGRFFNVLIKIFAANRVELDEGLRAQKIRVAIVGAGKVGVSLAEELLNSNVLAYQPKCFVDIDKSKVGREVCGLPIINEENATVETFNHYEIQEIIFALPQLGLDEKKKLYEKYKRFEYKIKVYDYPVMQQASESKRHLREFDVEELLFRKPVVVVDEKTYAYYKNKVVLITGGGGSIGSELCRQIAKMSPKQLVILDVYENGAYDVQQELKIAYKDTLDVRVEILSVCNRDALERIFAAYRPNVVINAAAHKHVPLMEHNCCEAIENNVFGTLNSVELSEKYNVERFMMVSTDKAVNPTNVMGATKRMCEMIVQSHSKSSKSTTYSATRFGNVLGSAGSVIPLFKRQIMNGGPITITDKRIIRYFMTIPEASQLVLQSGAMAKNGDLFVLDMGNPVKILDLAENMIRLSGFEPYRGIDIIETGLRPGEKLYEELLVKTEELDKTDNSMIFIERDEPISRDELEKKLEILHDAVLRGDDDYAREALHMVVPTFKHPEDVNSKVERSAEEKVVSYV